MWHAHFSWLRATVYGAIVIYPKPGISYPFKLPYEEHVIILGTYIYISPLLMYVLHAIDFYKILLYCKRLESRNRRILDEGCCKA